MPIDLPPIKNALTQLSGHTVIRPKVEQSQILAHYL
jgi:hypothetical protein